MATSTRVQDLVQSISEKLGLISADGFSVFVKTPDTVLMVFISLPSPPRALCVCVCVCVFVFICVCQCMGVCVCLRGG